MTVTVLIFKAVTVAGSFVLRNFTEISRCSATNTRLGTDRGTDERGFYIRSSFSCFVNNVQKPIVSHSVAQTAILT
jgi:hypothetical protein